MQGRPAFDDLVRRCGGKPDRTSVKVRCVVHEDASPSLSITLTDDGTVLWFCHAGCDQTAVTDAIRDRWPDLWKPVAPSRPSTRPVVTPASSYRHVCFYTYFDETGKPVHRVERREATNADGTRSKNFPQSHWNGTDWSPGVTPLTTLHLYHLPDIIRYVTATVWYCEGEKDADRLQSLGLVATTNAKERATLERLDATPLRGRRVCILVDNDAAGRKTADHVARKISPFASSVRMVTLPGLPEKGDVSDWLDAGTGTVDDLVQLGSAAPEWQPTGDDAEAIERLIAKAPDACPSCLYETRLPTTDPLWRDPADIGTVNANFTRQNARQGLMGFHPCGHTMPVRLPQSSPSPGTEDEDETARIEARRAVTALSLNVNALHGLAGDVVRLVDPHTEADPVAVLVSFIVAFGNAVGTHPYHMLGAEAHYVREFALIVGTTGTGRKGASWAPIRELMRLADGLWSAQIRTGLSSGEGLIAAVADEVVKGQKDQPDEVKIKDRRLLVVETEFSKPLRNMRREGNTLSPVIRDAWDHGDLATMTRSNSIATTGAHIGIIGHITPAELERETSAVDASNGFLNRFLFVSSRRSKALPRPEPLDSDALWGMSVRVRRMLDEASRIGRITWHPETIELWDSIYGDLSGHEADEDGADDGGMAGLLLNRREAHVLRLSMLYALMDGSDQIRLIHLVAAVELWWYCEQSIRAVFGDKPADHIEHKILTHLRQSGGRQSRTDISNLLGRHVPSARIDVALQAMVTKKQIVTEKVETGGRPGDMFSADPHTPPPQNEVPNWLRMTRSRVQ